LIGLKKGEIMAKILTDKELGEIIFKATHDTSIIECADAYKYFIEDLADLICNHFGGVRGDVQEPETEISWTVPICINELVPDDGGVFKEYDTDVSWKDGKEI